MAHEPVDVTIGGRDITLPAEWCETTYRGTKTGGRNWEFYDVTVTIDGKSYTGLTGWWDGDARNNVHLEAAPKELKQAVREAVRRCREVTVEARAFRRRGVEQVRCTVRYGQVLVYDESAGRFTADHMLSEAEQRSVFRLIRRKRLGG